MRGIQRGSAVLRDRGLRIKANGGVLNCNLSHR